MSNYFNAFDQIAQALIDGTKDVAQNVSQSAVEHIKEHIIANGQVETGDMLNSVEAISENDGAYQVTVGVDYAGYQNYGTVDLPPRPFFEPGLQDTQDDMQQQLQSVVDEMSKAGK